MSKQFSFEFSGSYKGNGLTMNPKGDSSESMLTTWVASMLTARYGVKRERIGVEKAKGGGIELSVRNERIAVVLFEYDEFNESVNISGRIGKEHKSLEFDYDDATDPPKKSFWEQLDPLVEAAPKAWAELTQPERDVEIAENNRRRQERAIQDKEADRNALAIAAEEVKAEADATAKEIERVAALAERERQRQEQEDRTEAERRGLVSANIFEAVGTD